MGRRKKHSALASGVAVDPEEEAKKAPHTFVINRGTVGKNINCLIKEMRRVMEPYTASKLKARGKNSLKDFLSVAGIFNVTHMMLFSKTTNGTNIRILRTPRGPTLTFHVQEYTLSKDVITSLKRPAMEQKQFLHHPLLVMNNFSGEGRELQLMATVFQNMFPSINVNKVRLSTIRRCVLFNYNKEDKTVEFRHYAIKAVPVGMSKGIKKLIKAKIPNLNRYDDVSEFLLKGGDLSESEAELDGAHNEVVLAQDLGTRGNIKSSKSAIRLTEIGPRLRMKLVKIEEGICDGPVLYHEYKQLTPEEKKAIEERRKIKNNAKAQRKKTQQENVQKKEIEKQRLKDLSLEGMKRKKDAENETKEGEDSDEQEEVDETTSAPLKGEESEDDDVAYFTQEVGEAPDKDLHISSGGGIKRKRNDRPHLPYKKKKFPSDSRETAKFGKGKTRTNDSYDKFSGKKGDKFNKRDSFTKKGGTGDRFSKDDFHNKRGKSSDTKGHSKGKTFGRGQQSGRGGKRGRPGRGRN